MKKGCDIITTVDLGAYLRDPDDALFSDLSAHLSECAECSAELRALAALHADAAGSSQAHLDEDLLLAYVDAPGSLDADALASVDAHLAECGQCRTEVKVLRGFDLEAAPPTSATELSEGVPAPAFAVRAMRPFAALAAAAVIVVGIFRLSDEPVLETFDDVVETEAVAPVPAARKKSAPTPMRGPAPAPSGATAKTAEKRLFVERAPAESPAMAEELGRLGYREAGSAAPRAREFAAQEDAFAARGGAALSDRVVTSLRVAPRTVRAFPGGTVQLNASQARAEQNLVLLVAVDESLPADLAWAFPEGASRGRVVLQSVYGPERREEYIDRDTLRGLPLPVVSLSVPSGWLRPGAYELSVEVVSSSGRWVPLHAPFAIAASH